MPDDIIDGLCNIGEEEFMIPESSIEAIEKLTRELNSRDKTVRDQLLFTQTLLDTVPVSIFYRDCSGRYLGCNKAFAELLGIPQNEIIGKHFSEILDDEGIRVTKLANAWLLEHGGVHVAEEKTLKDHPDRVFMTTRTVYYDTDEKPLGFLGASVDITECKNSQLNMAKMAKEWEDTFDSVNDGISLLDHSGAIIRCNKAMLRILGTDNWNAILYKKCWTMIHGTDEPPEKCALCTVMNNGYHTCDREIEEAQINGVWYVVAVDKIAATDITPVRFTHTMRDISKRMEALDRLRLAKEMYQDIVETATELVFRFRPNGLITFCNRAFCSLFEMEIEDTDTDWFSFLSEEAKEKVRLRLQSISISNRIVRITHSALVGTESRCFQFVLSGVFAQNGTVLEVQAIGRDATGWVDDDKC